VTDPVIEEWMYAREMARQLGIQPEEIYFEVYPSGKTGCASPIVSLLIRRHGLTFRWVIGATTIPLDKIQEAYEAACAEWNDPSKSWSVERFRASKAMENETHLVKALQDKGFVLGVYN
jgi:hypothetical protein